MFHTFKGRLCGISMTTLLLFGGVASAAPDMVDWATVPMRPLPQSSNRPLAQGGASYFVDAQRGNDDAKGNEQSPFKTITRGMKELKSGDTLVLRGGVYYEGVKWT